MDKNQLYESLSILDNKCSALLQLSSVVLALNIIPAAGGNLTGAGKVLGALIAVTFLATSLLSLFVIWIQWEPTPATLQRRTLIYQICVVLTATGLIAMAGLILLNLLG